ncbi:MAG TPA: hypothetical protein EYG50_08400 [Cycloclasticus sp.]|jgi:hypothetical protein|nr:hypothetical protein [Cycloclasticus sp.]HIL92742.1 hypothetical protein [Cycloclasticus sp.]
MRLYKEKSFSLEMGFSRKEFIALLDSQGKLIYERDENLITFILSDQQATITLGEEGVRRIASVRLPKLDVRFDLFNMDDDVQAQFMKTFLLKFHRGGG